MPDRIIRRLNGPRGSVLVFCALLAAVMAASCLPVGTEGVALPYGVQAIATVVPLWVYAVLWCVAGAVALIGAFRRRDRSVRRVADIAAFSAMAGMAVGWGVLYFVGWLLDPEPSRQWVLAGMFAAIGGVIANASRMRNPA